MFARYASINLGRNGIKFVVKELIYPVLFDFSDHKLVSIGSSNKEIKSQRAGLDLNSDSATYKLPLSHP